MSTKPAPSQTAEQRAALRDLQRLHDLAAIELMKSAATHLHAANQVERLLLSHPAHTAIQAASRPKGLR